MVRALLISSIGFILVISVLPAYASGRVDNAIFRTNIRTPMAFPENNPTGYPMVELNSKTPIQFHFDLMNEDREDFRYAIYHCDHNWNVSDLNPVEYLSGFQWQDIQDVEYSFNTQMEYVHYTFSFPSEMSKPVRSGNYGIIVYQGDDPFTGKVLSYRILIYENLVNIAGQVVSSSQVSERFKKQEIDFTIFTGNYYMPAVQTDLHVSVLQNGLWSTAINDLKPTFVRTGELVFDYNGPNNFDAGNEWRAFEVKSTKFAGINVERLMLMEDGWHVFLRDDQLNGTRAYQTEFDLNGKYFIRNDLGDDSFIEAEYVYVHFNLATPPVSESKVYVVTAENEFRATANECLYNRETRRYEGVFLLKQGYYNYRYMLLDLYHPKGDISLTEGNFHQTENDYHIIAYYFDRQLGMDRLIGISALNSTAH